VDMVHVERFLGMALAYASNQESLAVRARLLFPVFQAKWCCIILNDFLPDAAKRRRFADPHFDLATRKRAQLDKAMQLFRQIKC